MSNDTNTQVCFAELPKGATFEAEYSGRSVTFSKHNERTATVEKDDFCVVPTKQIYIGPLQLVTWLE